MFQDIPQHRILTVCRSSRPYKTKKEYFLYLFKKRKLHELSILIISHVHSFLLANRNKTHFLICHAPLCSLGDKLEMCSLARVKKVSWIKLNSCDINVLLPYLDFQTYLLIASFWKIIYLMSVWIKLCCVSILDWCLTEVQNTYSGFNYMGVKIL